MESLTVLETEVKVARLPSALKQRHMHAIVGILRTASRLKTPFFSLTANDIEVCIFAESALVDRYLGDCFVVDEETWRVISVGQDGGETDDAGTRVKNVASPLAEAGISILFQSSYCADYFLVKDRRMHRIYDILSRQGFDAAASPTDSFSPRHRELALHGSREASASPARSQPPSTPSVTSLAGSMTLTRSLSMAGSGSAQGSPVRASRARGSTFGEGGPVVAPTESLLTRQLSSGRERQREQSGATIVSPTRHYASFESEVDSETGLESSSGRASSPTPPTPPDVELDIPPLKSGFALGADVDEEDAEPRSWGDDEGMKSPSRTPAMHTRSPSSVPTRILPDELVMVGLDMDRETVWRSKLEDLLFYSSDHLVPVPSRHTLRGRSTASSFKSLDSIDEIARADPFGSTPTPEASHMRGRAAVHSASSVPTRLAGAPTPFVSFTATATDASLTADIRLLRLLFTGREEADESDGTILAVGEGGLRGEWVGEMADVETDAFDADDEDAASSSGDEALDRSTSSLGISVSPARRRRGRQRHGNPAYVSALSPVSTSSGRSPVVDSSRKLLKCLQLDLSEIEIDHSGSISQVANALLSQNVNLLYSSTLLTANALIGKADLARARDVLNDLEF